MTKNLPAPCNDCAFRRTSIPGHLGGSPAETFIGQVYGPFVIPCHLACNFDDPEWKAKSFETPQCAGAVVFRANIGVSDLLPDQLHKLPTDKVNVFGSAVEFMAHHQGISLYEAMDKLSKRTPMDLLREQLARTDNIHHSTKKEN